MKFFEIDEQWKKSIPSKVFYNHFYGIDFHLSEDTDRYKCKQIPYYNSLTIKNSNFSIDQCRKLLWNSWSTEYAFLLTSSVANNEYYKYALHWNFPQAYYSVYLNMTAFHHTQGIDNNQHEKSIKNFGNSIKDGHYPKAISFYSKGLHQNFQYINLQQFSTIPSKFTGLSQITNIVDAQCQIAKFLKSTREKNAEHKRDKLKEANDRRFLGPKGTFRKSFQKQHWDLIYTSIPETTVLNLLYRLRIKANYHDIESFMNADIDFKKFHECLGSLVSYLNFIHEAYIVKAIGAVEYEKILNDFSGHMNEDTAIYRYKGLIKEI